MKDYHSLNPDAVSGLDHCRGRCSGLSREPGRACNCAETAARTSAKLLKPGMDVKGFNMIQQSWRIRVFLYVSSCTCTLRFCCSFWGFHAWVFDWHGTSLRMASCMSLISHSHVQGGFMKMWCRGISITRVHRSTSWPSGRHSTLHRTMHGAFLVHWNDSLPLVQSLLWGTCFFQVP